METTPPAACSSEEHSISSVDLNKKRKLQYEIGSPDMPLPKQRFIIQPEELVDDIVLAGLAQPEESENDSNSFIGGCCDNSMAFDAKDANENSITSTIHQNQSSASLDSCSDHDFKSCLYALESRGIKSVNNVWNADLEGTLQFDPGFKAMKDLYTDFEFDHPMLEMMNEADSETETMILYFNDAAPHSFMLPSGRWNLGAPLGGAKKLTIDQEFEQYFSSLML